MPLQDLDMDGFCIMMMMMTIMIGVLGRFSIEGDRTASGKAAAARKITTVM